MAIKLSGSVSRKVPIKGVDFSSQSFGASMEIEINSADASEVQVQLVQLYASLNAGIDAQIAGVSQPVAVQTQPTPLPPPARNGVASTNRVAAIANGNGHAPKTNCTEAQAKCIFAVSKAKGIDLKAILSDFKVTDARDLSVKEASILIDKLKNGAVAH